MLSSFTVNPDTGVSPYVLTAVSNVGWPLTMGYSVEVYSGVGIGSCPMGSAMDSFRSEATDMVNDTGSFTDMSSVVEGRCRGYKIVLLDASSQPVQELYAWVDNTGD